MSVLFVVLCATCWAGEGPDQRISLVAPLVGKNWNCEGLGPWGLGVATGLAWVARRNPLCVGVFGGGGRRLSLPTALLLCLGLQAAVLLSGPWGPWFEFGSKTPKNSAVDLMTNEGW